MRAYRQWSKPFMVIRFVRPSISLPRSFSESTRSTSESVYRSLLIVKFVCACVSCFPSCSHHRRPRLLFPLFCYRFGVRPFLQLLFSSSSSTLQFVFNAGVIYGITTTTTTTMTIVVVAALVPPLTTSRLWRWWWRQRRYFWSEVYYVSSSTFVCVWIYAIFGLVKS